MNIQDLELTSVPCKTILSVPHNYRLTKKTNIASFFSCGLSKMDLENDFAALTCAQNRPPEQFEAITETCEQVLWVFKLNLTTSPIFLNQIEVECSRDKEMIDNCKNR